jgi:hypothetical protein
MQFIFRCILDVEEDVFRDIRIPSSFTLAQFHEEIRDAFTLNQGEMASFFRTDNDWEQGEEIPLIDMSDSGNSIEMKDYKLSDIFSQKDDKLIFVYDFLNLWTFYILLHDIKPDNGSKATVIHKIGALPKSAGEKKFKSIESDKKSQEDYLDEELDDYDNLDEGFGEDYGYEEDFNGGY